MTSPCLISEAAQRAEATVSQVRTYVAAGLVKPCATTAGGYFLFDELCVQRLRLVAAATRAGLRLNEIGVLIKVLDSKDQLALQAARRMLASAIGERRAALENLQKLVNQCHDTGSTEVAP